MRITKHLLMAAFALVCAAQGHAAVITQVFEFDETRHYETNELDVQDQVMHTFAPFDNALGTLDEVSLYASATSQAALEQFQCATSLCTVEFLLSLVLTLEPDQLEYNEAGNFTSDRSGTHFGGLATISYPTVSTFAPEYWQVEDFSVTPMRYLAYYSWLCLDCSVIDSPLSVTLRGSATLTYQYTPSPVPAPSTALLCLLGLAGLRQRRQRIAEHSMVERGQESVNRLHY